MKTSPSFFFACLCNRFVSFKSLTSHSKHAEWSNIIPCDLCFFQLWRVSNINQAACWPVHHFWGFIWSCVSSYLWEKKTFPCQINRLINHSQCRNPVADKVFPLLCFLCRRGTEVGRGWWWLRTCTTATYPQGIIKHVTAAVNSFWKSGI